MRAMRYRHLILLFTAAFQMVACGKDNPNNQGGQEGGGESEKPTNTPTVILTQDFTKGLGAFTIHDKDKGGFDGAVWKYESGNNAKYGAQASASKGSNSNFKAESWLISPEIDLTNYTDAYLCFNHAFAYVSSGEPKDYFSIQVSSDGGSNWVVLSVSKWLVSHSYFELAQSGNVPLGGFKGKKIKFAFVYKSTADVAPTWEITDLIVSHEPQAILPDDQGDQYKSAPMWMEMPQVTNENAWHAHTTILRFNRVRDYSFSYNESCFVSDWVAYPLYDDFSKNRVNRENSTWVKDPSLPEEKQANVASGGSYEFSSKGYDRGHQIPSADRSGGAMTNQHTFYTSNVTPQLHNFNGGIWNNLEMAVRGWSSSTNSTDTLYMVTGCIADASCPTVKDHDGKAVAVPKAYYKALLRLSKGSYIGAGFYLEHNNSIAANTPIKNFAMSLKSLEAKTGLTFFVNLPADKAAAIKAEDPVNNKFWNLK